MSRARSGGEPRTAAEDGSPTAGAGAQPSRVATAGGSALPDDQRGLGIGIVLIGLAVGYVLSSLATSAYLSATGTRLAAGAAYPAPVLVVDLAGLWVGLLGAVVVSARRAGSRVAARFRFRLRPWPDVPLGAAVGVAFQLLVVPGVYLPLRALIPHLEHRLGAPAREITLGAHGFGEVVVVGLVVVGAPIVEELFFRGLLLRSLDARLAPLGRRAGPIGAVVISGIVFGLVHAEPLQLLGLALFGIALGALAETTGRLGPGVVAHASFNAVAVVALLTAAH